MHIISIQIVASHCFDLHASGDCGLIYNVFYRVCRTNFDIFWRKGGYTPIETQPEIDRERKERKNEGGTPEKKSVKTQKRRQN